MCDSECPKANSEKFKYYRDSVDTELKVDEDGKNVCEK